MSMRRTYRRANAGRLAALLCALLSGAWVDAQELEPRSYANTPVGINFVVLGLGYATGDLVTDPATAIEDAEVDSLTPIAGFARSLAVAGRSAKIDAVVPFGCADGSAGYQGQTFRRDVCGVGDPSVKFSVNLLGAPALTLAESARWQQELIVGAGLRVVAPLGSYDSAKLLNIGSNRWSFRPEIGISRALGRATVELIGGAALYTDDDQWFGGRHREQEPIYSLQAHLIHALPRGAWIALDATGYRGGRTTVDGVRGDDLQENARYGMTLSLPLDRHQSIKLAASRGAVTRIGGDYDAVLLVWQYRWGAGL